MAAFLNDNNPFASETAPALAGDTGQRNRWYDTIPMAFNAIGWMLNFSASIQHTLCGYLVPIINHYAQRRQENEWLKSLGSEKVLSLYQAQQKRRDCDQRQATFNMLNKIKTLNDTDRDTMVKHLHNMISGVRLYHGLCHDLKMTPRTADIRTLVETYRKEGKASMMTSLDELKNRFLSRKPSTKANTTPTSKGGMLSREH